MNGQYTESESEPEVSNRQAVMSTVFNLNGHFDMNFISQ